MNGKEFKTWPAKMKLSKVLRIQKHRQNCQQLKALDSINLSKVILNIIYKMLRVPGTTRRTFKKDMLPTHFVKTHSNKVSDLTQKVFVCPQSYKFFCCFHYTVGQTVLYDSMYDLRPDTFNK